MCIKQNHNNEWMYSVWLVKRRRTMAYWPGLLYYWTEPALSLLQGRRKWRGNRPPPPPQILTRIEAKPSLSKSIWILLDLHRWSNIVQKIGQNRLQLNWKCLKFFVGYSPCSFFSNTLRFRHFFLACFVHGMYKTVKSSKILDNFLFDFLPILY